MVSSFNPVSKNYVLSFQFFSYDLEYNDPGWWFRQVVRSRSSSHFFSHFNSLGSWLLLKFWGYFINKFQEQSHEITDSYLHGTFAQGFKNTDGLHNFDQTYKLISDSLAFWSQDPYKLKMGDHFYQSVKICYISLIWVL
jgi:hypothetical protein